MPVPDFQSMFQPMLQYLSDGKQRELREIIDNLSQHFGLTEEDRSIRIPSGKSSFINRVHWAKTHLSKAGLIEMPTRGIVRISHEGLKVLAEKPLKLNNTFLKRYESFREFTSSTLPRESVSIDSSPIVVEAAMTPQESIETSYQTLRHATGDDLLDRLKKCSPAFFETVVVRLLQALGYGATGEALVTGRSGDAGIDGIIKEDKLGLDVVCVQAKRWEGTVGRPVIQAFVGSMDFVRARKGVVITTSGFSREATEYIERIEGKKVVLIDGSTLAELMIEYDVGVTTTKTYALKEVSNDFFDDDEG
jgi:restriction system protein